MPQASLRFRRRADSSARPEEEEADWEEIERELKRIDPAFLNPNLDPLEHALTVLESVDAEERLDKVRRGK